MRDRYSIDASCIDNIYSIGNVKRIEKIKEGNVNHNFTLKTDSNEFILQIFGDKFNRWKKEMVDMQFRLLFFLKRRGFPYEIPIPINNRRRKYISTINDLHFWIYKKIKGRTLKNYDLEQFKEIAKLLATYHKFIESFSCDSKDFYNFEWLFEKYSEMSKVTSKDKLDKLILKNLGLFVKILEKINEIDFGKGKFVVTHSDFSNENILFYHNKIKGIIDFDNIQCAPIGKDIAIAVKRCDYMGNGFNKRKLYIFLNEYKKYFPIKKIDTELIIPALIKDNCSLFWWFYSGMKKEWSREIRYKLISNVIKETKKLIRFAYY